MSAPDCPVFGVLAKPSMVDFPGRLAVVLFTSGCNFRCGFCHNAALLGTKKPGYSWHKLGQVCEQWQDQWVDGAVISGGEPTIWPSLPELIEFLTQRGLAVKLDTNGSRPDAVARVLPSIEYVSMDVKCSLDSYAKLTDFTDTASVARSVDLIKDAAADYEFRTTVVSSLHTDDEMSQIGRLIKGARRYVIQPFIPREDIPDADLRTTPRTSVDRLRHIGELMQEFADTVVVRGA